MFENCLKALHDRIEQSSSVLEQYMLLSSNIASLCRDSAAYTKAVQQKRCKLRNNFASKCRFEWLLSMLTSLFFYVYSTPCCNGIANGFVVACAALFVSPLLLLFKPKGETNILFYLCSWLHLKNTENISSSCLFTLSLSFTMLHCVVLGSGKS